MDIRIAVLREGPLAALIIIGPDNRHFPDPEGGIELVARRGAERLELSLDGGLVLHADPEAELDLRTAPTLRLARATSGGITLIDAPVSIRWPDAAPRRERA